MADEKVTISLLFVSGAAAAVTSVLFIAQTPTVEFPFNLNQFFWTVSFIFIGILPATAYVSSNFLPRVLAIGLFGAGIVGAVGLIALGADILMGGINVSLFLFTLAVSMIAIYSTVASMDVKTYTLGAALTLLVLLYLYDLVYLFIVIGETQNALYFVPVVGLTFIAGRTAKAWWDEVRGSGFREMKA